MPLPTPEQRTLVVIGARRATAGKPVPPEVIRVLRALAQEAPTLVALFDARSIASDRHLLSAWAHLGRSRARGEGRLRDRGAEFALFVAGDDQLPRALAKVGVSGETEKFVLVVEKPRDPKPILERLGLEEDPSAFPGAIDEALLDRLGITDADRSAVPREGWESLVLERVALLDLEARVTTPPKETK